jgi:hypothetical protein
MWLGGRVTAIFLALAAILVAAQAPARAAQNCSLTRSGDVYCDGAAQPVRVRVTGKVVQLAASGDSTCALTEPGEVYCWAGADQAAGHGASQAAGNGADQDADRAAAGMGTGDGGFGSNPLLLISIGLALIGAGFALVKMGSGQGARSRVASRHRSAPSLSRSV